MSTPVRVIVNFISRDPKSFVEAATKVRKEGGIELLCCIQQKYTIERFAHLFFRELLSLGCINFNQLDKLEAARTAYLWLTSLTFGYLTLPSKASKSQ